MGDGETVDGRWETGDAQRGGSLETPYPWLPILDGHPPGDAPYHDEDGCDP
jgi:hypothetical protein